MIRMLKEVIRIRLFFSLYSNGCLRILHSSQTVLQIIIIVFYWWVFWRKELYTVMQGVWLTLKSSYYLLDYPSCLNLSLNVCVVVAIVCPIYLFFPLHPICVFKHFGFVYYTDVINGFFYWHAVSFLAKMLMNFLRPLHCLPIGSSIPVGDRFFVLAVETEEILESLGYDVMERAFLSPYSIICEFLVSRYRNHSWEFLYTSWMFISTLIILTWLLLDSFCNHFHYSVLLNAFWIAFLSLCQYNVINGRYITYNRHHVVTASTCISIELLLVYIQSFCYLQYITIVVSVSIVLLIFLFLESRIIFYRSSVRNIFVCRFCLSKLFLLLYISQLLLFFYRLSLSK